MSRRATPLLVEDIWEAIEKIERYVAGLDHDTFINDDKTIDSVVRNLEIIGEAANRLTEDFRAQHPEIEWRKIIDSKKLYLNWISRRNFSRASRGSPKMKARDPSGSLDLLIRSLISLRTTERELSQIITTPRAA